MGLSGLLALGMLGSRSFGWVLEFPSRERSPGSEVGTVRGAFARLEMVDRPMRRRSGPSMLHWLLLLPARLCFPAPPFSVRALEQGVLYGLPLAVLASAITVTPCRCRWGGLQGPRPFTVGRWTDPVLHACCICWADWHGLAPWWAP